MTIPFDKHLPQLNTAFNLEIMQQRFTKVLLCDTAFDLESCEIGRVKYKPGQNCLIYYTLKLQHKTTREITTQIVCGRFYASDSLSRFEKSKRESLVQPKVGQPILHIPELELILWVFPNDRKLHHLEKLTDNDFLQHELLPQVVATHIGHNTTIESLKHQLVHYAPEHTCTVRAELVIKHHQHLTLYGKTYYNDEGLETYRLMQLLWNSQTRKQGLLNVAKPLSYHAEYNMLWQQGLAGHPLLTQEITSKAFHDVLRQVARTVATLHQTPLYCQKKFSLESWQQKLSTTQHLLSHMQPQTALQLEPLIHDLHTQANHLKPQPKATLHGDLHLQNFLLHHNTVSMIDLDNLCEGSPWQDIGSFLAGLYYRGLLETIPTSIIESLSNTFCEAYALASSWAFDEDAVRWYTATALINERIYRGITRLKTGRLESLDELIVIAKRLARPTVVPL